MASADRRAAAARVSTIVTVACSAGSLTALGALLRHMERDLPAAIVLLRHRSLDAPDALASLVTRRGEGQVTTIEDGLAIRPGWVHLAPPNAVVTLENRTFRVRSARSAKPSSASSGEPGDVVGAATEPEASASTGVRAGGRCAVDASTGPASSGDGAASNRFDAFLRTAVRNRWARHIVVVLDGSGVDGMRGARLVVENGGIVIAQDPEEARFGDLPRAMIASNTAHLVLPPDRLATEVARIIRRANEFDQQQSRSGRSSDPIAEQSANAPAAKSDGAIARRNLRRHVLRVLEQRGDQRFDHLPAAFVDRRLERRILVDGIERPSVWPQRLLESTEERRQLTSDLLVGTTWFFRDSPMWQHLAVEVVQPILESMPVGGAFRAWIAGCSTGEEAFSLAMLVRELIDKIGRLDIDLRVFATDVDREGLQRTALGAWPEASVIGVSDERRHRFFRSERGHARINSAIRDAVVAARHDVVRDVPFARMHLVLCRNFMRFVLPSVRNRLLRTLGSAVEPGGALVLGQPEAHLATEAGYTLLSQRLAIVVDPAAQHLRLREGGPEQRRDVSARPTSRAQVPPQPTGERPVLLTPRLGRSALVRETTPTVGKGFGPDGQLLDVMDDEFRARGIGCLVVNRDLELRSAIGDVAGVLQAPARPEVARIVDLMDEPLAQVLQEVVEEAFDQGRVAVRQGVLTSKAEDAQAVNLRVRPHLTPDHVAGWVSVFIERLPREGATAGVDTPSAVFDASAAPDPTRPPVEGERGDRAQASDDRRRRPWTEVNELEHLRRHFERALQDQRLVSERARTLNQELVAANLELSQTSEALHRRNSDLHSSMTAAEHRARDLEAGLVDLQQVLQSMRIGVVQLDAELKVVRFTTAAGMLVNLTAADIGRSISQVSHNLDDRELFNRVRDVLHSGEPAERLVFTPDGVPHRMNIHPLRRRDETISGIVMTFLDMTETRETGELLLELNSALDALQTRNREMEEFVYTVSHDLKSPLVTIGGLVGLMRESIVVDDTAAAASAHGPVPTPDAAEIASMFDLVEQTVETMRRLIDDLLEYSRIGRRFGKLEPVDLGEVALAVVHAHRQEIESSRVYVEIQSDLPVVIADRHRMEQVFDNLLVNALKYGSSFRAPRIEIGEASTEKEWRIFVRDNGRGIAPRHHERIFGLFERLQSDRAGSGVGLTIVKRIMEALRGRIWVDSAEGQGATFWLAFRRTLDPSTWPESGIEVDSGLSDEI